MKRLKIEMQHQEGNFTVKKLIAAGGMLALALSLSVAQAETAAKKPRKPAMGSKSSKEKVVKTKSGLEYVDLVEGKGPMPKAGQTVTVDYTGWLTDGKKFDSSN